MKNEILNQRLHQEESIVDDFPVAAIFIEVTYLFVLEGILTMMVTFLSFHRFYRKGYQSKHLTFS